MTTRMLIDARHREETRVAVVQGNRIEELDFESAEHRQLKGNIYLAKVIRVEPSLQAAFVDYGGNRHGFLAFGEIHPDYYQIPKEDREALLREEAEAAAEEERLRAEDDGDDDDYDDGDDRDDADEHGEAAALRADDGENVEVVEDPDGSELIEDGHADEEVENARDADAPATGRERKRRGSPRADQARERRQSLRHRYKIQDVIRRRQVLLVQVVKEERGNKGAALTTYLSLAGRYCVLMPNTSHGGGISRKISNAGDRKRLKAIMADLQLPPSMGCIVRTAGLQRSKTEIKRDFDYLARLWDEIREKTLGSAAPALIHQDSDLIKRAIRDIYHREIEEVIVEGEEGYRAARSFMRLLNPGNAKRVVPYNDPVPLFQRHGVEDQLSAMYHPVVQLKSGGYLVINPTEALVSIDINSGRSTREHNIEQTAYATNLEAAAEIARQLRLRDMAGLVVIDFIDMESSGNVRRVERAMKDALKNDRARIQLGRISSFGLMEMSRQRLRTGVLEASTHPCQHCDGTGLMRTASSAALHALRLIEDEAARGRGSQILLRAGRDVAVYLLNRKRMELAEIEDRFGVQVDVLIDDALEGARVTVDASGPRPVAPPRAERAPVANDDEEDFDDEVEEDEEEVEAAAEDDGEERNADRRGRREERDENGRGRGRGRGRRRRRGGRRDEEGVEREAGSDAAADERSEAEIVDDVEEADSVEAGPDAATAVEDREDAGAEGDEGRRRPRRGRRGGRRRGRGGDEAAPTTAGDAEVGADAGAEAYVEAVARPETADDASADAGPTADAAPAAEDAGEAEPAAAALTGEPTPAADAVPEAEASAPAEDAPKPRRRGRKAATEDGAEAPAARPRRVRRGKPAPDGAEAEAEAAPTSAPAIAAVAPEQPAPPAAPKPRRARGRKADAAPAEPAPKLAEGEAATFAAVAVAGSNGEATEVQPAPAEVESALAPVAATTEETAEPAAAPANGDAAAPAGPPRRGWWQRTFGA